MLTVQNRETLVVVVNLLPTTQRRVRCSTNFPPYPAPPQVYRIRSHYATFYLATYPLELGIQLDQPRLMRGRDSGRKFRRTLWVGVEKMGTLCRQVNQSLLTTDWDHGVNELSRQGDTDPNSSAKGPIAWRGMGQSQRTRQEHGDNRGLMDQARMDDSCTGEGGETERLDGGRRENMSRNIVMEEKRGFNAPTRVDHMLCL